MILVIMFLTSYGWKHTPNTYDVNNQFINPFILSFIDLQAYLYYEMDNGSTDWYDNWSYCFPY